VKSFFRSSFCPRLLELEHELIAADSELCMQYRIKAQLRLVLKRAFEHSIILDKNFTAAFPDGQSVLSMDHEL